ARCDADGDGRVTAAEFRGPPEWFARLDRDRDGAVTPADLDWSDTAPYVRQLAQARAWLAAHDRDGDGLLSRAELKAAGDRAAGGSDRLTPEAVRALLSPPAPPPPDRRGDAPDPVTLLHGLLTGEIGSAAHGPALGAPAPDFALPTPDGKRTVRL